ncbi:MAG TPA: FTR1 family protein [Sphingomicrobium sp.]|nr:FTR1 family protein [Sphingomicrobium sp.]
MIIAVLAAFPSSAPAQGNDVETAWRVLDYVAVDYSGAVRDGKVVSASEYAEMREFSASVAEKIAALPTSPSKVKLESEAAAFASLVERKAPPPQVASAARTLGAHLLSAYPVALGPKQPPDLARGAQLFQQDCASCHGAKGDAQTPMAKQLDPPPIAFADRERARQRSPFALYQVINQGLEGTAMQSFAQLPDADKWALAFQASRFAYPAALERHGKRIWDSDPTLKGRIRGLNELSSLSESELAKQIGADKAGPVIAYLRAHPEALAAKGSSLGIARARLDETLAAYRAGNRDEAKRLALAAYLDGFEPVEPMLSARNPSLLATVEQAMGQLRASIAAQRDPSEISAQVAAIQALFDEAEMALSPDQANNASAFLGAFAILLREGLEALLIVVAMLAFLTKADRPELARPVHAGWTSALAAGVLTWWAATSFITVSGASRELTEGFGSLLAAAILLFVGIWMHGKAQAGQWQRYIREKLHKALARDSRWFLFSLAFIAVYREVFETILFFTAMAAEGSVGGLVAGGLAGCVALAAIAVAMLRFSQRLPIGKFFAYSSALVAILAVVLAGKGVAALQEAGLIAIHPLAALPRISVLGLFPTLQGITAQLVTLVALLLGFLWNRWSSKRLAPA